VVRELHLDGTVRILSHDQSMMEAALMVRSTRADLLAENIANADTPNFVQRDVRFETALRQTLEQQSSDSSVISHNLTPENFRIDRNDIDLNQQLGKVYENSLNYLATLRLYSDSVARLRSATGNS
jgi:flagellar basal-body rod protein FlgB